MDNNKLSTLNIDLLLRLDAHGWSTGCLFIEHEILECNITHIFNDPYYDTMDALLSLIKGYDSSFTWFSEPYGVKIELKVLENNLIHFLIYDINKEVYHYNEVKDEDLELLKSFKINLKQLFLLFYYQFKKTYILLENKEYAINRAKYFPFQKFRQFEAVLKEHYEIR